jgi:kynurenine formamidase
LLQHLLEKDLPINLASINYRLSPEIVHPGHQNDVIAALNYVKDHYGMKQYALVGHSAGACLAFQAGYVVPGCRGIVGVEGIYDLKQLVLQYPLYRGFVEESFGKEEKTWNDASPTTIASMSHKGSSLKVQLVHSREDELLSPQQTEAMLSVLKDNADDIPDIAWVTGTHDETITLPDFFAIVHTFVHHIVIAKDV